MCARDRRTRAGRTGPAKHRCSDSTFLGASRGTVNVAVLAALLGCDFCPALVTSLSSGLHHAAVLTGQCSGGDLASLYDSAALERLCAAKVRRQCTATDTIASLRRAWTDAVLLFSYFPVFAFEFNNGVRGAAGKTQAFRAGNYLVGVAPLRPIPRTTTLPVRGLGITSPPLPTE